MDSDLRSFRHSISVLKKQGLLPKRTDTTLKLDARSAIPSMKVKGKRLDTLVRKFDDVVSGKTTALKVPSNQLPKYRRAGFETARGRILVPHAANEKARIIGGQVSIKHPKGIERVQIPVEFKNLKQYLRDIKADYKRINALKHRNEYFGIRLHGGQRANFYADIRDLIRDLEKYEAVQSRNRYKQEDLYKHLEIMRMNRTGAKEIERQVDTKRTKTNREKARKNAKKFRRRLKDNPEKQAEYNAATAQRQREYRARIAKDKEKSAHIRAMNKKHQKKWRKNNL